MDDTQKKDTLEAARRELMQRLHRRTEKSHCLETAIPGLTLARYDHTTARQSYLREPSLCLLVQGTKKLLLGEEEYVCDADHYLITSVSLPVISEVTEASPETPLLGLALQLDHQTLLRLAVDTTVPVRRECHCKRGLMVCKVTTLLLRALTRLVDLLNTPDDIPILAPLVHTEILYRLLTGEQGIRLRQTAMAGNYSHQIAQVINWMQKNYKDPFRVEDIASKAGMSTSAFHLHFRSVTAMSPLQFQKWIRLHEARRIMLVEHQDAFRAACQVGYESPSQFNREYRRQFGEPPLRDVKKIQKNGKEQEKGTKRSPIKSIL